MVKFVPSARKGIVARAIWRTCGQREPSPPLGKLFPSPMNLRKAAKSQANRCETCDTIAAIEVGMARHEGRGRGSVRPQVPERHIPCFGLRSRKTPASRCAVIALLACCFAPVLLLVPGSVAQNTVDDVHVRPRIEPAQPSPEDGIDPALRTHTKPMKVDVDLVLVPVTITDPMNRLVTGLDKENFSLFEGKDQQEIRHFSSEDAPVSLGVIFDMSASMTSKIERAREAVVEFFKTANPQDEFFMITFADKPEEVADFTNSVDDLQGKLVYTVPKGRTALLDAIYLGLSKMRQAKYPKKSLLIISDGGDNHSRYTEGEIKSLVKEADVLMYAIGIYDRYASAVEERLGPQLL